MKIFYACLMIVIVLFLSVPVLLAGDKPDFSNPDEVLADLRSKIDACAKAGSKCSVPCGYGLKTLKNFLKSNPGGDPSIFKQRWQPCYDAFRNAGLESAAADTGASVSAPRAAGEPPDFSNHEDVVAGIKELMAKCKGDAACEKECGYALKALRNFNHPQPHYAGLRKAKWEACWKKVPGMKVARVKRKASVNPSKFVIGGLQMGGNMSAVKDRLFLLKAYGYFKKSKREYSEIILSRGRTSPGPDIIRNYEGTIREETVYIFFEAAADGRVYLINFEQKEALDVDQVTSALIDRYGKPTRHQGNYLIWGCKSGPLTGFCAKANPSANSLTIWAKDEDIKKDAYASYGKNVLKAKGVKSGAKF